MRALPAKILTFVARTSTSSSWATVAVCGFFQSVLCASKLRDFTYSRNSACTSYCAGSEIFDDLRTIQALVRTPKSIRCSSPDWSCLYSTGICLDLHFRFLGSSTSCRSILLLEDRYSASRPLLSARMDSAVRSSSILEPNDTNDAVQPCLGGAASVTDSSKRSHLPGSKLACCSVRDLEG